MFSNLVAKMQIQNPKMGSRIAAFEGPEHSHSFKGSL